MFRILFTVAIAYAGAVLILLLLENGMVYQPCSAAQHWMNPPSSLDVQDVEIASSDGNTLHGWWVVPPGWRPEQGALLFCHGNGGNLSHRSEAIKPWIAQQIAVLIFDYPGFGKSTGKPSEAGCYAAGDACCDWLVEALKVPPERIIFCGGSLGSGVAVDLATRRPHRALVLVSAFTSIPDAAQEVFPWMPARWLARNQFDNLKKIGSVPGPVCIVHGETDTLIPFTHGQRLFDLAPEPKLFIAMPNYQHKDFPDPPFYPALWRFLKEKAPLALDASLSAK